MKKLILAVLAALLCAVSAEAATKSVTLLWDANTEPDLAGYRLYQGSAPGGPYSLKNALTKVTTTTFVLTATVPTNYYWVLTAVDSSGNESGYSNEVSFLFDPDVTPPAAPRTLRLAP